MSGESTTVEAFFEGAENVYDGAADNFNSKRVVLREKVLLGSIFIQINKLYSIIIKFLVFSLIFKMNSILNQTVSGATMDSLQVLGLEDAKFSIN